MKEDYMLYHLKMSGKFSIKTHKINVFNLYL